MGADAKHKETCFHQIWKTNRRNQHTLTTLVCNFWTINAKYFTTDLKNIFTDTYFLQLLFHKKFLFFILFFFIYFKLFICKPAFFQLYKACSLHIKQFLLPRFIFSMSNKFTKKFLYTSCQGDTENVNFRRYSQKTHLSKNNSTPFLPILALLDGCEKCLIDFLRRIVLSFKNLA